MHIYLIRHAETTGDVENRYGGDYDDHLSERGRTQVRELALKLRGRNIQMVFHSPRFRAFETAQSVSEAIEAPLMMVDDIRERNAYGVLTGMVKSEAAEEFPVEVEELAQNPIYHNLPESESYDDFKQRVVPALNGIMDSSGFDAIAIITHGGPINCFVREVLGKELEMVGDCAILELERVDGVIRLVSLDNAALQQ